MALLNVALPMNSFAFSHPLSFSNQRKNRLTKQLRIPSIQKRSSSLATTCSTEIARADFPGSFNFGAGSSALQTESSANEGGRGPSTWDFMLGDLPAVHSLVKFKDDVKCLKDMNADYYRFSICWSRILPNGKNRGPESINHIGVKFYNDLLKELKDNGIMPLVTLCHFDIPLALQEEYNGILDRRFVDDFNAYADLCFNNFGDKVTHWTTFNEPSVYCEKGYQYEMMGNDQPAIYPYLAAHHLLLAHATAVKTYRDNYQKQQDGKIGISLVTKWLLPYSKSQQDDMASTQRVWDFITGWHLDPIMTGDYPSSMKTIVRDRLPKFSPPEQEMLKGSYDFIGINYYTSNYTRALPFSPNDVPISYAADQYAQLLNENKYGEPIGPPTEGMPNDMHVCPHGLYSILVKLKTEYNNPLIYITGNGYPQKIEGKSKEEVCDDKVRIDYIKKHLVSVRDALREGVNVDGYFAWTLMDNMEVFNYFYTLGFGLHYVDYNKDYERTPKKSALWFKDFLSEAVV